jgi:energy-coupling factor transporter ATP-binding protein EcfA2
MTKLVLLGGPTGVGKSTVMRLLENRIPHAAILDADDVWRVSKELAVEQNRHIALSNVISVMRGYFEGGCETGILSWVFARSALYDPVIAGLEDRVDSINQIYLVSTLAEIKRRLQKRGDEKLYEYSKTRLELINSLPFTKIDTSKMIPEMVATAIIDHIGSTEDSR